MYKILSFIFLFAISVIAQDINKTVLDATSGKPILIGPCNREAFLDAKFSWWFNSRYKYYHLNAAVVENLKKKDDNYSVEIIMGTWCSDSRKGVPRFYKLLDALNIPAERITLINVDREKQGGETDIAELNINLVPTYIILRKDKEIGRIVETPNESLEKDLLKILERRINKI